MVICGMDEVGRGALAGPIVAAAVCCTTETLKELELNDSKKLSKQKREILYNQLLERQVEYRIESISTDEINSKGIAWANKELFLRLGSCFDADIFIVDGNLALASLNGKLNSIVGADSTYPQVMAASIIAKVTRDNIMKEIGKNFPMYNWKNNSGYGTKFHMNSIIQEGVCIHHRDLFVRNILAKKRVF